MEKRVNKIENQFEVNLRIKIYLLNELYLDAGLTNL